MPGMWWLLEVAWYPSLLLGNCTSGGKGERWKAVRECTKRPGRERPGKQSAPRIHNEGCGVRAHPPPHHRADELQPRGRRLPGWSKHDENRLGYPPARDRAHAEAARGDSAARGVGMQRRHGRAGAGRSRSRAGSEWQQARQTSPRGVRCIGCGVDSNYTVYCEHFRIVFPVQSGARYLSPHTVCKKIFDCHHTYLHIREHTPRPLQRLDGQEEEAR